MSKSRNVRVTLLTCSIALAGAIFATGAAAASAPAECSRATLQKLTDTYVSAQKAGRPAMLPLAANATYAENDKAADPAKGVLSQAITVDFTRSFHDTKQCSTFTEVIAATHSHPYVIHTRIEATRDGKVQKMESVVTDQGDWVFGAKEHLAVSQAEKWDPIPANKRDTREVIQAAADAYLNNWGDPALPVPHGTPCARLEGRIDTGKSKPEANTCDMGAFPEKLKVTNRRYVIDETVGAVSIFHNFPWIDAGLPKDPGTPASQTFRVEGGKNRYIHEVTVCTTEGCGRARPPGPGGPGPGPGGPPPGAPAAPGGAK
ncbi:MAG TPA: hypothetical protein VNQ32_08945 [Steroidobacteraceae bacterium]|nr:hypothetical protein [Steroidobacteraceae bacterium]